MRLMTSPSYDPSLWLLARDGDVPIGALTASIGDGGWVDWLGVLASHRGRGIAPALLRRSFAAFLERGHAARRLNVDAENVTGATAVYERVGDVRRERLGPVGALTRPMHDDGHFDATIAATRAVRRGRRTPRSGSPCP